MKRSFYGIALVAAILGMAYLDACADPVEEADLRPALCIIKEHEGGSLSKAREALARHGVRTLHVFPPKLIFGRFPYGFDEKELSGLHVEIAWSSDDVMMRDVDPVIAHVIHELFREGETSLSFDGPPTLPMNDLLLEVPGDVRDARVSRGSLMGAPSELLDRGIEQNSEFMIGTIVVNVIFPESAGGSEDWTDDELAGAMSGIALGLSQYQRYAPSADSLRLDYIYNYYTRIPVSIEPIEGDRNTDPVWMGEALHYLGYADDMWEAHTLNNDTRAQFGADWVFTAFIVDASFNGCWQGSAGYYAYGYLGGPLMVIPYPTCSWTSQDGFAHIFVHEASHIFWSLDEYLKAGFVCADSSGYLRVPTRNTYYLPCEEPLQPCVMNNAPLTAPLPICTYTLGQVGLADANENDVPDIYEVPPEWRAVDVRRVINDTIYTDLFEVKATVVNEAVPNRNPYHNSTQRIDYAPWLVRGTYRIGAGPEYDVFPVDGVWDESSEDLAFFISGFLPQENDLYLKVYNCAGLATEIKRQIYYVATMLQDYSVCPKEMRIEVSWRVAQISEQTAFAVFRSEAPSGEYCALPDTRIDRNGLSFTFKDESCERGIEYRYRVQIAEGNERRILFETGGAMLPALALRLYQNYPNPFNPSTEIRFSLPAGCDVALDVYDIKGNWISRLAGGYREKGLHIVAWNGRDGSGREVSSGIYFYRLRAGKKEISSKMVLLR